jgi:hypothetical protein
MTVPAARATTADAGRFGRIVRGAELRQEILDYGPAFLNPLEASADEAFTALVGVLTAYALGSRTAARLVRERQATVPSWTAPARHEALELVRSLAAIRQYLPHLLGQRVPPELANALGRSRQQWVRDAGTARPVRVTPATAQHCVVTHDHNRPGQGVLQRPIVSISSGSTNAQPSPSRTQRAVYSVSGS